MQASCSLPLSLLSLSVAVQVVSVLLLVCREVIVLEQTRNHSMSSSASDDLTSAYTGSDDICSSDYACNSEDMKTTNPERDDDPDSAELSSNYDHESMSQVRQAQFHKPCRARIGHQSRYHQRLADSG